MTSPIEIQTNVELAPLTTLGVGGSIFSPKCGLSRLIAALAYAKANGMDVFVLGGGSNIVVADGGFDGLVIRISIKAFGRSNAEPIR